MTDLAPRNGQAVTPGTIRVVGSYGSVDGPISRMKSLTRRESVE